MKLLQETSPWKEVQTRYIIAQNYRLVVTTGKETEAASTP